MIKVIEFIIYIYLCINYINNKEILIFQIVIVNE